MCQNNIAEIKNGNVSKNREFCFEIKDGCERMF
jgi:hypothetical protein